MDYNLSQTLNHINETNYDDDITATVQKGQFIVATSNQYPGTEAGQREIICQVLEMEGIPGGNVHTNCGLYVRQHDETSVLVILQEGGHEVARNVTKYP